MIRSPLTILLTNRQVFLAYRQGGPLYWLEQDRAAVCPVCRESHAVMAGGEPYRSVVFATEPLSGEEWRELDEGRFLFVDPDFAVDTEQFA